MKGGVFLPSIDNEPTFFSYLENSTFEFLSSGGYGIVLKCNVDVDGIAEPFKSLRYPDFNKPITHLCIKLCIVSDISIDDSFVSNVTPSEFENEINVQTDIFLKTFQYLQPLAPGIVYTNVLNMIKHGQTINDIYSIIIDSLSEDEKDNLDELMMHILLEPSDIDYGKHSLGIIGMEIIYADTLSNQIKMEPLKKNFLTNIGRYAYLNLALMTGYNHGDFHQKNILLAKGGDYFKVPNAGYNYTPIILDFGRTAKISPEVLNDMKEAVSEKNYVKALSYLCDKRSSNKYVNNFKYIAWYGWICGDYKFGFGNPKLNSLEIIDPDINQTIDNFFTFREGAIDDVIQKMKMLHDNNPNVYPLLPLGNQVKNKLYNGMIGGRRKRNRSIKKRSRNRSRTNKKSLKKSLNKR